MKKSLALTIKKLTKHSTSIVENHGWSLDSADIDSVSFEAGYQLALKHIEKDFVEKGSDSFPESKYSEILSNPIDLSKYQLTDILRMLGLFYQENSGYNICDNGHDNTYLENDVALKQFLEEEFLLEFIEGGV